MSNPEDAAFLDQAIHWLVRMRYDQPTQQTRNEFEHWLAQRPEHARAWSEVETLGSSFAALPPQLARQTLDGTRRRMSRRDSLKLLAILAGAGGLAWSGYDRTPLPGLLADYRTTTGQRLAVDLGDGSRLQLNTASAFDQQFDPARRLLVLQRGELLLDSSGDMSAGTRPFWIRTRDGYLRFGSGRFLVRLQAAGTLVAVQKGEATILPGSDASLSRQPLGEGGLAFYDGSGLLPYADNGLDLWSWSEGVLSVRNMRLGDFIAELDRYRSGLLHCSAAVENLRVSGTYQLGDTDQVLALLQQVLPVRIAYRTRYLVEVQERV